MTNYNSYNTHYTSARNVTELMENAINRSVREGEIVTIEAIDAATYEGLCSALFAECEGDAERADVGAREFWAANLDGDEWRVHVRLRA